MCFKILGFCHWKNWISRPLSWWSFELMLDCREVEMNPLLECRLVLSSTILYDRRWSTVCKHKLVFSHCSRSVSSLCQKILKFGSIQKNSKKSMRSRWSVTKNGLFDKILDFGTIVANPYDHCSKETQTFDLDLNDKKNPKGFELWTIANAPQTDRWQFLGSIVADHHLCSKETQSFDLDLNDKKNPKGFELWTIENGPRTYRDSFWDLL